MTKGAQLERVVFEERSPLPSATIGSLLRQCSFGQQRLTMASSRVVADVVTLPCSGTVQTL